MTLPTPTATGILAKLLVGMSLNGELSYLPTLPLPWPDVIASMVGVNGAEMRRNVFAQEMSEHGADENDLLKVFSLIAKYDPNKTVTAPWGFDVQTAPELMAQTFEPLRFIIPGILPEGCTLLPGSPKTGKSTILLSIAYGVALGGYVLGKIKVEQRDVVYFALEDGPRRVQDRLRLLSGSQAIPGALMFVYFAPSIGGGLVASIDAFLETHPKVGLVIVDTLAKARGMSKDKDQGYQQDYQEGSPFTELTTKRRIGLVLVHHTRKAISADPMDMVNATQGLAASVDNVLVLQRERFTAGGDARLSVMGRDVETEEEIALTWDPMLKNYIHAGKANEVLASKERRGILSALASNRLVTVNEIAAASGRTVDAAFRMMLSRMVQDGSIANPERGKYLIRARFQAAPADPYEEEF